MLLVVAAKEARLFIKPKSPLTFSTTTTVCVCIVLSSLKRTAPLSVLGTPTQI